MEKDNSQAKILETIARQRKEKIANLQKMQPRQVKPIEKPKGSVLKGILKFIVFLFIIGVIVGLAYIGWMIVTNFIPNKLSIN